MKLTKNELKSLIKECLVEILAEGLGRNLVESAAPRRAPQGVVPRRQLRDPVLDRRVTPPSGVEELIRKTSHTNPALADMLADTAKTTLVEQMAAGDTNPLAEGSGARITQQEKFHGTPEQVFGDDVTSKWEDLAFRTPTPSQLNR